MRGAVGFFFNRQSTIRNRQCARVTRTLEMSDASPHPTDELFCPQCDYSLRGLSSERCPECGFAIGEVLAGESVIPWVHRTSLGFWRAYWRTVWLATFRQRRLRNAMARSVSFAESQKFRWTTILFAYLPLLLVTGVGYAVWWRGEITESMLADALRLVWPVASIHVGYALFLAAATGVPSYFFHPKDLTLAKQNRAIAMSYYTCGPLATLIAPMLAVILSGFVSWQSLWRSALITITMSLTVLQAFAWYFNVIDWVRWLMPGRVLRTTIVGVAVPTLWFIVAWFTVVGFPLGVVYVALVVSSFG